MSCQSHCRIKEPPAASGVTVPHTTAAPRGDVDVGRGLNAGKASVLGELSHTKPTGGKVSPPWDVQMGNGNVPLTAPGALGLPVPPGCLHSKTHPGGKGRIGIPFPALCVSPREHKHRWENPAQVWDFCPCFGIPRDREEQQGATRSWWLFFFFFSMRKIFLNFMGGGLGAADVTF